MKNIAAFDAADYLDNDVVIAEYLNAALEDENPNVFLQAIADVAKARAEPGFADLPILIHGYDHALPSGFPGDRRDPIYADRDQWLGAPMHAHGIEDSQLREAIIRELIDELYAMLGRVAGDPDQTRVHLVDARGAIGREQWNDEIHGTDAGFAAVAERFRQVLQSAMTS